MAPITAPVKPFTVNACGITWNGNPLCTMEVRKTMEMITAAAPLMKRG